MAKVVVVSGWAPNLVRFRGKLIEELLALGHKVVAVAPEPVAPEELLAMGARYLSVPMERAGTRVGADLRAWLSLTRLFRREQPDAVLLYNPKPVIYGGLAAWAAGVAHRYPVITGLGYVFLPDGTLRQQIVQTIAQRLYRASLSRASTVFVQNPDDRNDLIEAGILDPGQRCVRVHGSGVDIDAFPLAPPHAGPPTFLFVGRLLKDKGVFEYVEAARQLHRRYPNVRFRMLGPLDDNPSSLSRADVDDLQADGTIEYLGVTDDVRPYLRDSTVMVLPSYREGTPRSVLEALSTGRAVITTDVPGCRETVVDGENGLVVPARDAGALAEAMETLLQDPDRAVQMGLAGRAQAELKFDVRRVNAAMLAEMGLESAEARRAA